MKSFHLVFWINGIATQTASKTSPIVTKINHVSSLHSAPHPKFKILTWCKNWILNLCYVIIKTWVVKWNYYCMSYLFPVTITSCNRLKGSWFSYVLKEHNLQLKHIRWKTTGCKWENKVIFQKSSWSWGDLI